MKCIFQQKTRQIIFKSKYFRLSYNCCYYTKALFRVLFQLPDQKKQLVWNAIAKWGVLSTSREEATTAVVHFPTLLIPHLKPDFYNFNRQKNKYLV